MKPVAVRTLIAAGAMLVLAAVNFAIEGKERVKAHGETVLLELAPVDPRGLMQGDYMALRFSVTQNVSTSAGYKDERLPLTLIDHRVGRVTSPGDIANLHIRYRVRNGEIWIGTNAFFFEEGSANRYSGARYGEFKVDPKSGEAVLVGLRDTQFQPL